MGTDAILKCRICGNEDGNKIHLAKEMMMGTRDLFEYLECTRCGCIQLKDIPEDLAAYYPDNYYSYQLVPQNWVDNPANWSRAKWKVAIKRRMLKMVLSEFPGASSVMRFLRLGKEMRSLTRIRLKSNDSILDVGCGRGWLLHTLRELGYKNVLGIDPYIQSAIEYGNGLTIKKATLQDSCVKQCDLVMFHHSFEHSPFPREDLAAAFRALRKGGICLIRIPLASSWAWRHYQVNWVQLDAPRHIYLHTAKSIEIMAGEVGFRLKGIVYDSSAFQIWGSEQYMKNISLEESRFQPILFSKKELAELQNRADHLNSEGNGDQAAFYLIKR